MSEFATEYGTLRLQQQNNHLRITLDRPESRNALNQTMIDELSQVFAVLQRRHDVKAVVLRGNGGNFCAGADLKRLGELKPLQAGHPDPVAVDNRRFGTLLEEILNSRQVVVAAIEGYALAGGLGLACVSDIAIVSNDAIFGITEVRLGLVPAQMGPFVAMRIGGPQTKRLALTAARFRAEEAVRLGIGHFLVAGAGEMESKVDDLLRQIDQGGPMALAATKSILNESLRRQLPDALDFAAQTLATTLRGEEAAEGLSAFAQKRRPHWAA